MAPPTFDYYQSISVYFLTFSPYLWFIPQCSQYIILLLGNFTFFIESIFSVPRTFLISPKDFTFVQGLYPSCPNSLLFLSFLYRISPYPLSLARSYSTSHFAKSNLDFYYQILIFDALDTALFSYSLSKVFLIFWVSPLSPWDILYSILLIGTPIYSPNVQYFHHLC